ncbi:MAG: M48 family metallopeptidase, partial [Bdellovibrio sp.]|nr:M48 family metallopeptidase [Bdellovibrio sp.]
EQGEVGVNRQQFLNGVSSEEVITMSTQSYEQVKKEAQAKGNLDKNAAQLQRVQKIANKLIPQTTAFRKDATAWKWEVHVITSDEINAWCMPGGKIAFYTGILEKLNLTDAEIAAVMGHEISHALREHGRERMAQDVWKQKILAGGAVLLESQNIKNSNYYLAAANLATTFFSLKYGRTQETEADDMGIELMARAGYNPEEAVNLWKKMAAQSSGKPPEILSTHPADATRIANIQSLLPRVMPLYQKTLNH